MTQLTNGAYADDWEQRLTEACEGIWDALVDPREAYVDDDGLWWNPVATGGAAGQRYICAKSPPNHS